MNEKTFQNSGESPQEPMPDARFETSSKRFTVVLCEAREATDAQRRLERELADRLASSSQVDLAVLPHLYDLAPEGEAVRFLRSIRGNMAVLGWNYPRAQYWVLKANQVEGRMGRSALFPVEETEEPTKLTGDHENAPQATLAQREIWCFDLRSHADAAPVVQEIERLAGDERSPSLLSATTATGPSCPSTRIADPGPARWYPVIDHDRCVNCLECLNFCLFGAYGLDEAGQIIVEQPDACRDGCPACSRICPSGAILFPDCPDPAIAGGPAGEEPAPSGPDVSNSVEMAQNERQRALAQDAAADKPLSATDLDHLVDALEQTDL